MLFSHLLQGSDVFVTNWLIQTLWTKAVSTPAASRASTFSRPSSVSPSRPTAFWGCSSRICPAFRCIRTSASGRKRCGGSTKPGNATKTDLSRRRPRQNSDSPETKNEAEAGKAEERREEREDRGAALFGPKFR
ncbi:hypothetical protein L596_015906 [Steinernema carpocapsae]|uniref:Uncharacterized protein n=1 Tax=Steinernema carpocapsae TaxID=34508 RepID=A0A4U5NH01_STECR|nr:hypothetical protein L596_015906 [Steinernema carpocapsae]